MGSSTYSESDEETRHDDLEADGKNVAKAHKIDDPFDFVDSSLKTIVLKDGRTCTLQHFKVKQLSPSLMKWIMDLMERNMKKMYRKSAGGWKLKAKKREMTEENSRYIVAFFEKKPVAFSHFQFDMDYGREVLYCYELQVELDARSCGLGKRIMESLEKMAEYACLPLVVLTVFKFNLAGLEFFKRLGYATDETCPDEDEEKDYVILSKKVC